MPTVNATRTFSAPANVPLSVDCNQIISIYLLVQGEVTAPCACLQDVAIGEMALIECSPRSADVTANTPIERYALSQDEFYCLEQVNPALRATLLTNLLRHVSHMLRRLTQEVAVLAG